MPYLNCPSCELTIYSAAVYSTTDDCPRCATPLRTVAKPPRLVSRRGGDPSFADVDVAVEREPGGTLVTVVGSLSYPLATRFETAMGRIDLERDELLTIDLHGVTDIDSSGLAALLSTYLRARREGFDLCATRPAPRVARIFALTGADRWLKLADPTS